VSYDAGTDLASAVQLAKQNELVIVFAQQWSAESMDNPRMSLDGNQDALIAALATVNKNIVVVLQSGGPVLMPWLDKVAGVLQAWFPGSQGGAAIERVLTGEVNPSGRLPQVFPRSLQQLPRPQLDGYPEVKDARIDVNYNIEGAAVGYKWFDRQALQPLFPFGYGLSYSKFDYANLKSDILNGGIQVSFTVLNTGKVAGKTVAQLYAAPLQAMAARWEAPKRLAGFAKVNLQPGANTAVSITIEPRLLASYDAAEQRWIIAEGDYRFMLSKDAGAVHSSTTVHLARQVL
jgi:beta-glucosidase